MTRPICPHCARPQHFDPARHASLCPDNPDMQAAYRAALEDPAQPGSLRIKPDYEAARGDLYSGTYLMRLYRCGWPGLAERFGLTHTQAARKPINWMRDSIGKIGEEIDEEIERCRDIVDVKEIGLPVLRFETRQIGNVYQRVYTIR